jgi:hypothetical protein
MYIQSTRDRKKFFRTDLPCWRLASTSRLNLAALLWLPDGTMGEAITGKAHTAVYITRHVVIAAANMDVRRAELDVAIAEQLEGNWYAKDRQRHGNQWLQEHGLTAGSPARTRVAKKKREYALRSERPLLENSATGMNDCHLGAKLLFTSWWT